MEVESLFLARCPGRGTTALPGLSFDKQTDK